jgi:gas vesicle protein
MSDESFEKMKRGAKESGQGIEDTTEGVIDTAEGLKDAAEGFVEGVKETAEGVIEGVRDTTNVVKEEIDDTADVVEETADEVKDSDTYERLYEDRKGTKYDENRDYNKSGEKEPMTPENIVSHEPTAVKRDKNQGSSGDAV